MLQEKLSQIGFTPNESIVYLGLLKLGPQAVSIIAKRTFLNRTTAYAVLKSLEKKGVISSCVNGNIKYFAACDPNSLIGYVDRKCQAYSYYRSQLLAAIPQFRCMIDKYNFKKPVVSYFDGLEGVKHVMYDALSAKDVLRSYHALNKWFGSGMRRFLLEFRNIRITDKKVPLKAIVPDTDEVRAFFKESYCGTKAMTHVLYNSALDFSGELGNGMNIYNDKVSIFYLDAGDEYAVLIQSQEIAEMHKRMFDMAWKGFEAESSKKS